MIDIHVHLLPGIDDGAKHMEDFWEMSRAAVAEGIHTIIATPHHLNGVYKNPAERILPLVYEVNQRLQEKGIPLVILPGQELRVVPELLETLEQKISIPLTGEGPYLRTKGSYTRFNQHFFLSSSTQRIHADYRTC